MQARDVEPGASYDPDEGIGGEVTDTVTSEPDEGPPIPQEQGALGEHRAYDYYHRQPRAKGDFT